MRDIYEFIKEAASKYDEYVKLRSLAKRDDALEMKNVARDAEALKSLIGKIDKKTDSYAQSVQRLNGTKEENSKKYLRMLDRQYELEHMGNDARDLLEHSKATKNAVRSRTNMLKSNNPLLEKYHQKMKVKAKGGLRGKFQRLPNIDGVEVKNNYRNLYPYNPNLANPYSDINALMSELKKTDYSKYPD